MMDETQPQPTLSSEEISRRSKIITSLTASEAEALNRLIARCKDSGLFGSPEGSKEHEVPAGIDDEVTFLRFLRARKFDADAAYDQFKETYDVRNAADTIGHYNRVDIDAYDETRKLYPHWTGRRDKRGNPVCFYDIKSLDQEALTKYNAIKNTKEVGLVPQETANALLVHDGITRFVFPLCSAVSDRPNPSLPVSSSLYLVDISALTIRQAWNARRWIQDISKLLSTNFPELLDKVLIMGAPAFFPKVWPWIKPWIDPVTAAKIQFVAPEEVLPILTEHMNQDDIPVRYGGSFEFDHGMLPNLDDAICATLSWCNGAPEPLPIGPLKWTSSSENRWTLTAVGTEHGKARATSIATMEAPT